MKRKEWVILAALIGAVAALELFGPGDDQSAKRDLAPERTLPARSVQSNAPRSADLAGPPDTLIDPMEAFRTVRLHVTGMT